ncbi:MAG: MerR family transcriptional regulator [Myxococcales bacterium]|nr:MerR family transcriptional regulator [Myxococcales bacterium]
MGNTIREKIRQAQLSRKQAKAASPDSTGSESHVLSAPAQLNDDATQEERVASLLPAGLLPKDGKLYYRIGEVSKITGVKPYVLRYWESEFRWMAPQKSRSKQRLYRRKDIEMILLIQQLLHSQRYTIAGARKRLRELGIGRALEEAAEESAREAAERPAFDHADSAEAFQSIRNELLAIREML